MKKGAIPKDFTGQVFTRWTVMKYFGIYKHGGNSIWECKCECGTISNVVSSALVSGKSKSCGCMAAELTKKRNATHGYTRVGNHAPEYNVWEKMRRRCFKPQDNRYYRYGARGITVCDRWRNSFENFIEDMGLRPSSKHSLDRIDNNGNYEPSNCKWSTDDEQRRNKSTNVWLEYNGERLILKDWINKLGICRGSFYEHKKRNNLTHEETFAFYCKKFNL